MTEESVVTMWAAMTSWFTPTSLFLLLNLTIGTIALSSRFTSSQKTPNQPRDNPTPQLFRASSLLQRVKSINFSLSRSENSEQATSLQHSEVVEEQTQYSNSDDGTHQLTRASSILDLVKPFNFSFHRFRQSEAAQETQHLKSDSDSDSDHCTDSPATTAELESYRSAGKMQESVSEKPETKPRPAEKMQESVSEKPETKPQPAEKMKESVSVKPETKPHPAEVPKKMLRSMSEKLRFWRAEEEENVEHRRPATVREEKTVSSGDDEGVDGKADDFINKFRQQLKLQRLDSMLRYKEMITRGSSR